MKRTWLPSLAIANRYKERTNIFYINGGDRPAEGAYSLEKWNAIGETLDATDPNHLITFHPRGPDNRRHAWRSVLAGSAGYTYGHNAIWQFNQPGYPAKFNCRNTWQEGIEFIGGAQMQHIKNLMLSRMPYFDRIPDQSIVSKQGTEMEYLVASRGERYAFVHSVMGSPMQIAMGKIAGAQAKASWYDPRTGKFEEIGPKDNAAGTTQTFDPPGEPKLGNDWVLVLDSI